MWKKSDFSKVLGFNAVANIIANVNKNDNNNNNNINSQDIGNIQGTSQDVEGRNKSLETSLKQEGYGDFPALESLFNSLFGQ